jgi:hypothetical protein
MILLLIGLMHPIDGAQYSRFRPGESAEADILGLRPPRDFAS